MTHKTMVEAKAKELQSQLKEAFPEELKVEVSPRQRNNSFRVIASAKSWEANNEKLTKLAEIAKDHTITFGRTGANFRMIFN